MIDREKDHDWEFEDFFDDEPEEYDPGAECGRWNNGRLMKQCTKAGSEECDWDCPYSR